MTQPQQAQMIPCLNCGVIRAAVPSVIKLRTVGALQVTNNKGQVQAEIAPCPVCLLRVTAILDWWCGRV